MNGDGGASHSRLVVEHRITSSTIQGARPQDGGASRPQSGWKVELTLHRILVSLDVARHRPDWLSPAWICPVAVGPEPVRSFPPGTLRPWHSLYYRAQNTLDCFIDGPDHRFFAVALTRQRSADQRHASAFRRCFQLGPG